MPHKRSSPLPKIECTNRWWQLHIIAVNSSKPCNSLEVDNSTGDDADARLSPYGESLDESGSTWAAFTVIKRSRESLVKLKKKKKWLLITFFPPRWNIGGSEKIGLADMHANNFTQNHDIKQVEIFSGVLWGCHLATWKWGLESTEEHLNATINIFLWVGKLWFKRDSILLVVYQEQWANDWKAVRNRKA